MLPKKNVALFGKMSSPSVCTTYYSEIYRTQSSFGKYRYGTSSWIDNKVHGKYNSIFTNGHVEYSMYYIEDFIQGVNYHYNRHNKISYELNNNEE